MQEQLEKRLERHGYKQIKIIPGYCTHTWQPISFTLFVENVGVKYTCRKDAKDLLAILRNNYELSEDWEGKRYIGLTLNWDYVQREFHLSMPGYVDDALIEFGPPLPKKK